MAFGFLAFNLPSLTATAAAKRPLRVATMWVLATCCVAAPAAGQVEIIDLGNAVPNAVSADGTTVVGTIFHGSPGPFEAFRWTRAGGVEPLGGVLPPGSSFARAVSGDGSVLVGHARPEAFRWDAAGGVQFLGGLPGEIESSAAAISDDGAIIVGSSAPGTARYEPFRWTESGGMERLGSLLGKQDGVANGISGDGTTIVGHRYGGGMGWRWTEPSGFSLLPGEHGQPLATNVDGSIIVGSSWNELERSVQPTLWQDASLEFLGLLPGAAGLVPTGQANAMSVDGKVIGGGSESERGREAFIWTRRSGMLSLADYVASLGEPGLLDPHPGDVWGISADGRVLAAASTARSRGWIVVMPTWFPCLADCDGSGALDVFDFLCFQNLFAAGSPGADCDGSGALDFFDFLCFQSEFAAGCP